jgi:endonuclease/exonuclease/phosphatase (EEP) superfamily protein YafD
MAEGMTWARPDQPPARTWPRRLGTFLVCCAWLYLAVLLGAWALLDQESDHWWVATVLMFAPRWPWGVPLLLLAPLAYFRPRVLWALLPGLVVVVVPLMGLCLPWRGLLGEPEGTLHCRVLTCNVHSSRFDAEALRSVIEGALPDIVALQDWSPAYQFRVFELEGWHVRREGQFCVASRFPIKEARLLDKPARATNAVFRTLHSTPAGDLYFFTVHLATPRDGLIAVRTKWWQGGPRLQANSDVRLSQSAAARAWINEVRGPVLVAGDFNTPTDSTIYSDFWSDFTNAFSEGGLGWGHTHYTNRTRLRIDHILAGPGWSCGSCWVGPDINSEHRPVIADLVWAGKRE